MSESYKNSLKLTELTLLINGVRIYPSENKLWVTFMNFLFYFNLLWLYRDVYGEIHWLIEGLYSGKNLEEISLIIPCATISILSTSKTLPMFYYQDIVRSIVEKLSKMYPLVDEKPLTDEDKKEIEEYEYFYKGKDTIDAEMSEKIERKIVHESSWFINTIIRLWFYSCLLVIVTWSILPMIVMSYEYLEHGEVSLKLPFLTTYFFDSFTKITYPLVYIHQIWSTVVAGFYIFGGDTFIYNFCMNMHMHFLILSHRFEFMVSGSIAETKKRLRDLVKRHQELIELIDQMETVSQWSSLLNFVMSSVLICLCAFNITFSSDTGAVFAFVTFLMSQMTQISMLCFFGDLLMRSSLKVSDAIYKSRWYDLDPDTKKTVALVFIRSQKPCRLTGAKFADVNLSAFTTILSRSWSYFALLRTVYD